MVNDKTKSLYEALSKDGYNVGSYENFTKNIQDEGKRKSLYDAISADYSVGDYDSFSANLIGKQDNVSVQAPAVPENPAPFTMDAKVRDYVLANKPDMFKPKSGNLATAPFNQGADTLEERYRVAEAATKDPYLLNEQNKAEFDRVDDMIKAARSQRAAERQLKTKEVGGSGLFSTLSQAYVAGEQNETDRQLEYASTLLDEARKVTAQAERSGKQNFFQNFAQGFTDSPLDTWTLGLQDLKNMSAANKVVDKVNSGSSLTPSEEALMQAMVVNAASKMYNDEKLGIGYNVGSITAQSLPFMLNMIVGMGAVQSVTKPASKALLKYATDKLTEMGVKGFGKALGRGAARTVSGLGDVAFHTATFGAPLVAADYERRQLGQTVVGVDASGRPTYKGQEGQQTGAEAFGKAVVSTAAETGSELVGEYFGPMLGAVGRALGVNKVGKIFPKSIGRTANEIVSSPAFQEVKKFADAAKITDPAGEYMEEVLNNLVSVGIGDMSMEQFTDLDQNIETFLGVAPMSVLFGGTGAGNYVRQKYRINKEVKNFERKMSENYGEDWTEIRNALQNSTIEEARNFVKDILSRNDLSKAEKKDMVRYVYANMQEQTLSSSDVVVNPEEIEANKREIFNAYQVASKRVPFLTDEDKAKLPMMSVEEIESMDMPDDVKDRVIEYKAALEDYNRYIELTNARVQRAREQAIAQVEELTNYSTGTVMRVKSGFSENPVHILRGKVTFNDKGGVDASRSDKVIYYMTEDGSVKMGSTSMIQELIDETDASALAEQAANDAQADVEAQETAETSPVEVDTTIQSGDTSYYVQAKNPNGTYLVSVTTPQGEQIAQMTEQQLQDLITTQQAVQVDEMSQQTAESATTTQNVESTVQNRGADNMSNFEETLPRDDKGNFDFSAFTPQQAYQYTAKMSGEDVAREDLQADVNNLQAEIDKLADQAKKAQGGKRIQIRQEIADKMNQLNSMTELLNSVTPAETVQEAAQEEVPQEIVQEEVQAEPTAYEDMDSYDTLADLNKDLSEEEVDAFVANNIKEYESQLGKVKAPKIGTDKAAYLEEKKAVEAEKAEIQRKIDYWKGIQGEITEMRSQIGEKEAQEILSQDEPQTAEEYAALKLGGGTIKLNRESYLKETGYGNKEAKKMFGLFSKDGVSIERAGEMLEKEAREDGYNFFAEGDVNAGRAAVLNVLSEARTRGDLINYIKDRRQAQAERQMNAERAYYEDMIERNFNMTVEEYESYVEVAEREIGNRMLSEEDYNEFMSYFADETLNETEDGRKETDIERSEAGGEVLQGEQPDNAGGSTEVEAEPTEVDGRGDNTDDVAPEEVEPTPTQQAIQQAESEVNTEPTEGQKEAGNYNMGHVKIDGMDISIENPKGSTRSGVDANGKEWSVTMNNTYGYIRGTRGVDGDHIDIFLSDNPESGNVYVVDQIKEDGSFDEHKVMYGFDTRADAEEAYLANYSAGWKGLGNITEVTKEQFKKWIESSHRKTKPFAEYKSMITPNVPDEVNGYKKGDKVMYNGKTAMIHDFEYDGRPVLDTGLSPVVYTVADWEDVSAYKEPKQEKKPSGIKQISVEGLFNDLKTKGTARFADNVIEETPAYGSQNKVVSTARYEELRKKLRSKLNNLNAGYDPELFQIGAEMAAYHVEAGVRKFADFAKIMLADIGEEVRPYLKLFYNGVREFPGMESYEVEMDPYEEVRKTDINSIKLEEDEQTEENAESVAGKAEAVANEAESRIEEARTEDEINDIVEQLDEQVEDVNKQLSELDYIDTLNSGMRVVLKDGRNVLLSVVMHSGEQISATQFSKPHVSSMYASYKGKLINIMPEDVDIDATIKYNTPKQESELAGDSSEYQDKASQEKKAVEQIGLLIKEKALLAVDGNSTEPLNMKDVKKILGGYSLLSDMSPTDMQELVELAMTNETRKVALKYIAGNKQKFGYDFILAMYNAQPLLNARDSTRFERQQYSTPTPFGYVMGQFVQDGKQIYSVLEPSAGNGALTITFPSAIVHVNDIDDRRLANLRTIGYREVTNQDALVPFNESVDAVMTNPPFGITTTKEFDGGRIKINSLEGLMAINALESMKDDGRAAIVIGGNTSYRDNGAMQSKDMKLFSYLYTHYNVVDVINLDGDMYKRNGTKYDVRIILINGRKKDADKIVAPPVKSKARAEQVKTFEELYNRVQDDIHRIQQMGTIPSSTEGETESADGKGIRADGNVSNSSDTGERRGPGYGSEELGSENNMESTEKSAGESNERKRAETAEGLDNVNRPDKGNNGNISQSIEPAERGGHTEGRASRAAGPDATDRGDNSGRSRLAVNLGDEKVAYPNRSQSGTLMSVVPANQAKVLADSLEDIGDVDQFLVNELGYSSKEELFGYLAAEQIDSVSLAINQMNKGNGFIIGDMTGVGKGRQGAALIRYAVRKGYKPIYFTQKPALFSDNYRDLADIGSGELRPFIIGSDPKNAAITDAQGNVIHKLPTEKERKRVYDYILKNGTLPDEYDYVITTYSQINNGTKEYEATKEGITAKDKTYKKKSPSPADKSGQERRDVLEALSKDNIMILDESHTAGGSGGGSMFMQYIMPRVKGVTFLSATFAKRADNMPVYAMKTDLAKSGITQQELIGAIAKGGVTLQEIMSKQLVQSGQMIRRERSFNGVTIDWLSVSDEEDAVQRKQFDEVSSIFSTISSFQKEYVNPLVENLSEELAEEGGYSDLQRGTVDLGASNTPFASKMYNLVNQLLFSLKADAVANRVIENLKNGFKPVISFTNTMEGFLDEAPKGTPMDVVPNFSLTLLKALDGVMRYTETDIQGKKINKFYTPDELGEEGKKKYYEIKNKIEHLSANLPISPMDAIKTKIEEAGYKVGEITGRNLEMVRNEEGKYIVRNRKDKDKKSAARDFNNGQIDVLMINKSGSTGISLHASPKFHDQRQRVMVFAQFQSDINDEVQMRGRIDRTGQIYRGKYEYIMSSIPAEQRLQMMFKAKLKSLDANTTSSQKSKFNEMQVTDFLNKYGDEVVYQYMIEHPELSEKLGDPLNMLADNGSEMQVDETSKEKMKDSAAKIVRYLPFLPVKEQEEVFKEITDAYAVKIQLLNDAGENDLEITTMPLKAKTLSRKIWKPGAEPNSGNAFADNTYIEEVEVDVLKKPMKSEEIKKESERLSEGKPFEQWIAEKEESVNKVYEDKVESLKAKLKKSTEERIAKAKETYIRKSKEARDKGKNEFTDDEIIRMSNVLAEDIKAKANEGFEKQKNAIDSRRDNVLKAMEAFEPMKPLIIPTNLEEETATIDLVRGMFVGFKFSKDYSPSSSTAVFATLDGRRKVEIPLKDSKAFGIIRMNTSMQPSYLQTLNIDTWDSFVPTQTRNKAYIVTGNLLQALVDVKKSDKARGYLVSYSTEEGETKQGMLMSEGFQPSDLTTSVPIRSRLEQVRRGETVVSEDKRVVVEKNVGWRGGFSIKVPKSKKQGGEFFEDKVLRSLVNDKEFTSKGNFMVGEFGESSLPKLLDRLSNMGVKVSDKAKLKDAPSDVRFRFIGEQGAANLDRAEEASTRLDNLSVAREMESVGKDAKTIKMATGWERGADGKWRYETIDIEYIPDGKARKNEILKNKEWYSEFTALSDNLFNGETLTEEEQKRFDELSDKADELRKQYDNTEKLYLDDYVKDKELFAAYPKFKQTKLLFVDNPEISYSGKADHKGNQIIINLAKADDVKSVLAHEIQHIIQEEEGFARGGNKSTARELYDKFTAWSWRNELTETQKENPDLSQADVEKKLIEEYKETGMEDMIPPTEIRTKGFNLFARGYDKEGYEDAWNAVSEGKVPLEINGREYDVYNKLSGEVEARNVQTRLGMTPEQRRSALASETEDVAREDQIFIYDYMGANSMSIDANDTATKLGVPITVHDALDSVPEGPAKEAIKKGRKVKGWYDTKTGTVHVYMPNATSAEDVQKTILHEGVAHYGLRHLVGEEYFDDFLDEVFANVSQEVRGRIVSNLPKYGYNSRVATEEYMATLAENGVEPSVWNRIKQAFKELLRKVGIKVSISDNELKYILWRSAQNLRMNNPLDLAKDVAMQYNMGVGNYLRDTFFREDDAIEAYNQSFNKKAYWFKEAWQDSMLALKNLQDVVAESSGEPIKDFENAYMAENQLSRLNKAQSIKFWDEYMQPLANEVAKMVSKGTSYQDIIDYLMLSHGIERNVEMSNRERINDMDEQDREAAYEQFYNDVKALRRQYKGYDYLKALTDYFGEVDDYSATEAILSRDGNEHTDFQNEALERVREFEASNDVTALRKLIKAATDQSLRKTFESGMMGRDEYNRVKDMFAYYAPLRGWEGTKAEDVYDYMGGMNPVNSTLKKMEGRNSIPDDPIATIGNMGESAIVQGNRNAMKQKFYNMAVNHPTDLITMTKAWYAPNANGDMELSLPQIDETDNAETIAQKIKDHDELMKSIGATRKKQGLNISYPITSSSKTQHAVIVKIGGKDYVLYINGNPRAAQAINGLTNPDAETTPALKATYWLNRNLSALYTSKNPEFVVSNFMRDYIEAFTVIPAKEDSDYNKAFRKNMRTALVDVAKGFKGKLKGYANKYFTEFTENGGQMGYFSISDVNAYKKKLKKQMDEITGRRGSAKKALDYIWDSIEAVNKYAETVSRYATYRTSREMGRSIEQSIKDASDVTVNFSKKGSGYKAMGGKIVKGDISTFIPKAAGFAAGSAKMLYLFINPAIQSLANWGYIAKRNKKAIMGIVGGFALSGYVMPIINQVLWSLFGDDDRENPYNDLPEWTRRNNICIGVGIYLTIPLPHTLRAFYGMGEMFYQVSTGRKDMSPEKMTYEVASQLTALLPIDPLGNDGDIKKTLTPSYLRGMAEAYIWNEDFMGTPIAKITPYNENDPEWKRVYKGTAGWLVDTSKFFNDLSAGKEAGRDFRKGAIDFNPAKMEHIGESYFGGIWKFLNNAGKTIYYTGESLIEGEMSDDLVLRNVPFVRRFLATPDERTSFSGLNDRYYDLVDEMEQFKYELDGVKRSIKDDPEKYTWQYEELMKSDDYKKYKVYEGYRNALDNLYKISKSVSDEEKKQIENYSNGLKRQLLEELK